MITEIFDDRCAIRLNKISPRSDDGFVDVNRIDNIIFASLLECTLNVFAWKLIFAALLN